LSPNGESRGAGSVFYGAAMVFMAYEGFQLLTYDYDDIEEPKKNLPRAVLSAIVAVIAVYVVVAIGAAMLVGADEVVRNQEVALAVAGERALGTFGLIAVTVGAAFSTSSAINSTLFSTARLTREVAEDGELPVTLAHRNRHGVPDRAVLCLGALAAVLAMTGRLASLIEAASLAFLGTFAITCWLAFHAKAGLRAIGLAGSIAASAATALLAVRMVQTNPWAIGAIAALVGVAVFVRPIVLRRFKTR
jgi:amino acid transporter